MSTTVPLDLAAPADEVARLAANVPGDLLSAPTPCPDYAVRELLGHLVGLSAAFRDAARKDLGASTGTPPGETLPELPAGWRAELPARLGELVAAWRDPEAWTGMTRAGGVDLPGEIAGRVAMDELVLHGWDLAVATGQDYRADPAALRACAEFLEPAADETDRGPFGPVVAVPAGAPLLHRVVGLGGRDPHWRP